MTPRIVTCLWQKKLSIFFPLQNARANHQSLQISGLNFMYKEIMVEIDFEKATQLYFIFSDLSFCRFVP